MRVGARTLHRFGRGDNRGRTASSVAGTRRTQYSERVHAIRTRLLAFLIDYLLILAYLAVLAGVGTFLTLGPFRDAWRDLLSTPARMDFLAFLVTVLPVTLYFALSESSSRGASVGKRRMGLRVVGMDGGRVPLGRALVRSALKFLPWQLAHTGMLNIPGFPIEPTDPPAWTTAMLVAVWVLVVAYLFGLTPLGGSRPLYDRVAGTRVVASDQGQAS